MIAITTRSSTRVKAVLEVLLFLHRLPPPPYLNTNFPHGIVQQGKEFPKEESKQYVQNFKQTSHKHRFSLS
jgi:adenylate cyclase